MRQSNAWKSVFSVLAVVTTLYHIYYVVNPGSYLGIPQMLLQIQPFLGGSLALALSLTLLMYRAKGGIEVRRPPWYDMILIVAAVAGCGYYFLFGEQIRFGILEGVVPTYEIIFMMLVIIVLLETGRRTIGIAMSLVAGLFFLHIFVGRYLPGILYCAPWGLDGITHVVYQQNQGIFGVPVRAVAAVAAMFIVFAEFLRACGAADFFINLSLAVMGRVRGGPAKVAVVASALFGTLSGSITANIAGTGSITIPLMKRIGYRSEFAGAVETVSSAGGMIMPPVMGAVAFIMAEMIGISYGKLILMATIPALLYFFSEFVFIDYEAAKANLSGLPQKEIPSLGATLRGGWHYLVPLVLLVFLLTGPKYRPAYSAFFALLLLLVVTAFNPKTRITASKALEACENVAASFAIVFPAVGLAGIIMGSIGISGLGVGFGMTVTDWAGGNTLILLVLAAAACFVLGMGMGAIAIYIIVSTLIAPPLVKAGFPLFAVHLFVFYWALVSFLTPPVAVGAYIAAGIAKAHPMKTALTATRLGMAIMLVPLVFIYRPALLLIGSAGETALATILAIIGVWGLVSAISGYALKTANWVERAVMLVGSTLIIGPWGIAINLAGLGVLGLPVLRQLGVIRGARRRRAPSAL